MILVGAGSGMSSVWSILNDHLASGEERPTPQSRRMGGRARAGRPAGTPRRHCPSPARPRGPRRCLTAIVCDLADFRPSSILTPKEINTWLIRSSKRVNPGSGHISDLHSKSGRRPGRRRGRSGSGSDTLDRLDDSQDVPKRS